MNIDPSTDQRLVVLRRLALLCAVLVLAVTALSAYIRLSKAGLGCANWPQCYGQSLRQASQGMTVTADESPAILLARLAHRVTAGSVLVLVLVMVLACFATRPVLRVEGAMALTLLGLVVFLAVLGRWSSGARVPAVAIGNLLGGFTMLALSARLALADGPPGRAPLRAWVVPAMLLVLAQVALGGLVSASYAGLSCRAGWMDCLHSARQVDWHALDPWREPALAALPAVNPAGALPQALHRCVGLGVLLLLTIVAVKALRRGQPRRATALLLLFAMQAWIGMAMAQGSLPIGLAVLHNLTAQGLLVVLALLL